MKRHSRTIISNNHFLFFNLFIVLLLIPGCGGVGKAIYPINVEKLFEYDNAKKLDYTVELRLDDRLCSLKYLVGSGLTYYADMGESFCYNAKLLAEGLFRKVIVTNGKKKIDADLIMTPQIVKVAKSTPLFNPIEPQKVELKAKYAWDRIRLGLYVRWMFTDNNEKVLWVDVIEGLGEGKMGGPFSYKPNSIKQIRAAMKDMFQNTYDTVMKTAHFLRQEPANKTTYEYEYINWRIARTRGSQKAYENFLNHFPNSVFAPDASRALDQIIITKPDATTYACEGWASVHYPMTYNEVIYTLGRYGLIKDETIKCDTDLNLLSKSSNTICTNKDWNLKFYKGKLFEKEHFLLCDDWEEYCFPFLLKYLKLDDPGPQNSGRARLR